MPVLNTADDIKFGTEQVDAVHYGEEQVWVKEVVDMGTLIADLNEEILDGGTIVGDRLTVWPNQAEGGDDAILDDYNGDETEANGPLVGTDSGHTTLTWEYADGDSSLDTRLRLPTSLEAPYTIYYLWKVGEDAPNDDTEMCPLTIDPYTNAETGEDLYQDAYITEDDDYNTYLDGYYFDWVKGPERGDLVLITHVCGGDNDGFTHIDGSLDTIYRRTSYAESGDHPAPNGILIGNYEGGGYCAPGRWSRVIVRSGSHNKVTRRAIRESLLEQAQAIDPTFELSAEEPPPPPPWEIGDDVGVLDPDTFVLDDLVADTQTDEWFSAEEGITLDGDDIDNWVGKKGTVLEARPGYDAVIMGEETPGGLSSVSLNVYSSLHAELDTPWIGDSGAVYAVVSSTWWGNRANSLGLLISSSTEENALPPPPLLGGSVNGNPGSEAIYLTMAQPYPGFQIGPTSPFVNNYIVVAGIWNNERGCLLVNGQLMSSYSANASCDGLVDLIIGCNDVGDTGGFVSPALEAQFSDLIFREGDMLPDAVLISQKLMELHNIGIPNDPVPEEFTYADIEDLEWIDLFATDLTPPTIDSGFVTEWEGINGRVMSESNPSSGFRNVLVSNATPNGVMDAIRLGVNGDDSLSSAVDGGFDLGLSGSIYAVLRLEQACIWLLNGDTLDKLTLTTSTTVEMVPLTTSTGNIMRETWSVVGISWDGMAGEGMININGRQTVFTPSQVFSFLNMSFHSQEQQDWVLLGARSGRDVPESQDIIVRAIMDQCGIGQQTLLEESFDEIDDLTWLDFWRTRDNFPPQVGPGYGIWEGVNGTEIYAHSSPTFDNSILDPANNPVLRNNQVNNAWWTNQGAQAGNLGWFLKGAGAAYFVFRRPDWSGPTGIMDVFSISTDEGFFFGRSEGNSIGVSPPGESAWQMATPDIPDMIDNQWYVTGWTWDYEQNIVLVCINGLLTTQTCHNPGHPDRARKLQTAALDINLWIGGGYETPGLDAAFAGFRDGFDPHNIEAICAKLADDCGVT